MSRVRPRVTIRLVGWGVLAALGLALHGGTALLRLHTFWPYPKLMDFSGFYAAAWAWRAEQPPYEIPEAWLMELMAKQAIPFRPPPIYNPPTLLLLILPFTAVPFPLAAWLWTCLNIGLVLLASHWLAELAGVRGRQGKSLVALLTLSYGPLVLDMSLGQVSVLLLTCALVWLRAQDEQRLRSSTLALAAATGLKLFPAYWFGTALFTPWKVAIRYGGAVFVALASISVMLMSKVGISYARAVLIERVSSAAVMPGVDDQSLLALAVRLTQPQTLVLHGLEAGMQRVVSWTPRVQVPYPTVTGGVTAAVFVLGMVALFTLALTQGQSRSQRLGAWSAWLVLGLIALPHMERYNHVLLLPAWAWLWGIRPQRRGWVIGAYAMEGLARLTHVFAWSLPFPLAAWMSGWGLYAALITFGAVTAECWTLRSENWNTYPQSRRQNRPKLLQKIRAWKLKLPNLAVRVENRHRDPTSAPDRAAPSTARSLLTESKARKRLVAQEINPAKLKMDTETQKMVKAVQRHLEVSRSRLKTNPDVQTLLFGDKTKLKANLGFKIQAMGEDEVLNSQSLTAVKVGLLYNGVPGFVEPEFLQNLRRLAMLPPLDDGSISETYDLSVYTLDSLPLDDTNNPPEAPARIQPATLLLNDDPSSPNAEVEKFPIEGLPLND